MPQAKYKHVHFVNLIQTICPLKISTIKIIYIKQGAFAMALGGKRKDEKNSTQNKRNEGLPVYLEPLEHTPKAENDIEVITMSKVSRTNTHRDHF